MPTLRSVPARARSKSREPVQSRATPSSKKSRDPKALKGSGATKTDSQIPILALHKDPHFNRVLNWAVFLVIVCLSAELSASTAYGKFGEGAAMSVDPRIGWYDSWVLNIRKGWDGPASY